MGISQITQKIRMIERILHHSDFLVHKYLGKGWTDMSLLEQWRQEAYNEQAGEKQYQMFWANYFNLEKGFYESLLSTDEVVTGTIPELAEKYKEA